VFSAFAVHGYYWQPWKVTAAPHPLGNLQHAAAVVHALQLYARQAGQHPREQVGQQEQREAQEHLQQRTEKHMPNEFGEREAQKK
jgi:hypothetical protein